VTLPAVASVAGEPRLAFDGVATAATLPAVATIVGETRLASDG
jgi:hypothetical protein